MKHLIYSVFLCLLCSATTITTVDEKAAVRANIDWMWGEHSAPAKMRCVIQIVGGRVIRGNISAHQCVVNAIVNKSLNDDNAALNWLCAGQCHNGDAQAVLSRNMSYALQYMMDTYGDAVPAGTREESGNTQIEVIRDASQRRDPRGNR